MSPRISDVPAQDRVDGTVTRTYVADDTGRIVRFCDPNCSGSNPTYLVGYNAHGDALGIGRVDPSTGAVTVANRFRYATWGTPTTTTVNGHPDLGLRYLWVGAAGVAWDNSAGQALYDMHARTYSPVLGRFLQPDPARADGNLYAYAGNDPVTKSDPSGLRPGDWVYLPTRKIRPPGAVYVWFAQNAFLAIGCSRLASQTSGYPTASKTLGVICFLLGIQIGMTEDYLLVRAAYNWRTGAVWFRWTRFIYRWSDTYARGAEHLERYDQGGRKCAEALIGWGSPYNVTLCR